MGRYNDSAIRRLSDSEMGRLQRLTIVDWTLHFNLQSSIVNIDLKNFGVFVGVEG